MLYITPPYWVTIFSLCMCVSQSSLSSQTVSPWRTVTMLYLSLPSLAFTAQYLAPTRCSKVLIDLMNKINFYSTFSPRPGFLPSMTHLAIDIWIMASSAQAEIGILGDHKALNLIMVLTGRLCCLLEHVAPGCNHPSIQSAESTPNGQWNDPYHSLTYPIHRIID